MRLTLRSAAARHGRETLGWLAIGGTLAAMFLTAHQVRQGWAQRRVAAERAVRDNLTTAAVLIGTEAAKMSALELRALLWPALGTNGSAWATTSSPMYCSAPLSRAAHPTPREFPGPSSTTVRGAKVGTARAMMDRWRIHTE